MEDPILIDLFGHRYQVCIGYNLRVPKSFKPLQFNQLGSVEHFLRSFQVPANFWGSLLKTSSHHNFSQSNTSKSIALRIFHKQIRIFRLQDPIYSGHSQGKRLFRGEFGNLYSIESADYLPRSLHWSIRTFKNDKETRDFLNIIQLNEKRQKELIASLLLLIPKDDPMHSQAENMVDFLALGLSQNKFVVMNQGTHNNSKKSNSSPIFVEKNTYKPVALAPPTLDSNTTKINFNHNDKANEVNKTRYADTTVQEYFESEEIQKEVFNWAKSWRSEQDAYVADLLAEKSINGSYVTLLKRNDYQEFTDGLKEKMQRKEYSTIGEMDDIARGRVNLESWEEVEELVRTMRSEGKYNVIVNKPKRPSSDGTQFGYPRYHVIVEDEATGMNFEWQIGTQSITDVYEKEGIRIPEGLILKPGMKPNLHDIEYDIFQYLNKKDSELAKSLGIPELLEKTNQLSMMAGAGYKNIPKEKVLAELQSVQNSASIILQNLFDEKGQEYINTFFH